MGWVRGGQLMSPAINPQMTIADINTLARMLVNADSNSYTAAQLLLAVNNSYERITGKILALTAGGKWKYGDYNYSAFPTFTLNLTNGTQAYRIFDSLDNDTYPDSYGPIMILGAEVKDQDGKWHLLTPITLDDIHAKGIAQSEYYSTNGRPIEYEKREDMIVLYPAPDNGVSVTLTAGLRIFFLRTADRFTSSEVTAGTKEPGFPSPWHDILSYEAAYLYAITNGLPNAAALFNEVSRKEKELLSFIFKRDQDDRPIMTMAPVNYL